LTDKFSSERNDSDILFTMAAINAIHRQFLKALKCIQSLEKIDPEYPGLWRLKAKIYELMGDAETAAIYWSKGKDGFK